MGRVWGGGLREKNDDRRTNFYRRLYEVLGRYRKLVPVLVCLAVAVVATEGVGLGSVLLLLGAGSLEISLTSDNPLVAALNGILELPLPKRVQMAALALVALTFLRGGLQYLQELIGIRLRTGVERELQVRLFRRYHEVSLDFLQKEGGGAFAVGLTQYTSRLGQLVLGTARAIANLILLFFYVAFAFVLSWSMALVAVLLWSR